MAKTVPNAKWILATCILASSLSFIDGSVVNVGLPSIAASLKARPGDLTWVINAYLLPLGALLLTGGAAGDRFGRKRLLIAGTLLFGAASLACALAPTLPVLLAARAAQGVGAAILQPNSLAILGVSFEGEARGRAVGLWAAAGAVLGAIGPVLGGWLIDTVGWRFIFLITCRWRWAQSRWRGASCATCRRARTCPPWIFPAPCWRRRPWAPSPGA